MTNRYVIVVVQDLEAELHGPFESERHRVAFARAHLKEHGDRDGLIRLDISQKGLPRVYDFGGGEVSDDDVSY